MAGKMTYIYVHLFSFLKPALLQKIITIFGPPLGLVTDAATVTYRKVVEFVV